MRYAFGNIEIAIIATERSPPNFPRFASAFDRREIGQLISPPFGVLARPLRQDPPAEEIAGSAQNWTFEARSTSRQVPRIRQRA
jgi:hypothetical protein